MKKKGSQNPLLLNQRTLALAFGVSVTTITNWDKEGLPSNKIGKQRTYDLPACIKWFIAREAAKLSSLNEEQARFVKVKRERQEIALQQERGELVWASDAKNFFTMAGLHLKNQLESLPNRLSGRLSGMSTTREISLLLKKEMAAVLSSFKDMKLE